MKNAAKLQRVFSFFKNFQRNSFIHESKLKKEGEREEI
jgi:hypothetical protein